jgi:hypothetical protein
VRIALLMFLLQIFPDRRFQLAVKILIAYTCLHTLAFFFAVIFQCSPVAFAWDKELRGQCLNLTALTYAAAVLSGVLDCVTLILPLNELRKLKLSLDKKLGVIFMFIIGSGYVTSQNTSKRSEKATYPAIVVGRSQALSASKR